MSFSVILIALLLPTKLSKYLSNPQEYHRFPSRGCYDFPEENVCLKIKTTSQREKSNPSRLGQGDSRLALRHR